MQVGRTGLVNREVKLNNGRSLSLGNDDGMAWDQNEFNDAGELYVYK